MPRLRNIKSGAVVSCSEETARRLGVEWESADKAPAKAPSKKAPRKSTSSDGE